MKPLYLLLSAAVLTGCASHAPVTQAESMQKLENDERAISAAVPSGYKTIITDEIHKGLKDPYSIREPEISRPGFGFVGLLNGGQAIVVCARLNAKNSFGGYTGVKTWAFIFRNQRIAGQIPEGQSIACQGRAYFPFPEVIKKS